MIPSKTTSARSTNGWSNGVVLAVSSSTSRVRAMLSSSCWRCSSPSSRIYSLSSSMLCGAATAVRLAVFAIAMHSLWVGDDRSNPDGNVQIAVLRYRKVPPLSRAWVQKSGRWPAFSFFYSYNFSTVISLILAKSRTLRVTSGAWYCHAVAATKASKSFMRCVRRNEAAV